MTLDSRRLLYLTATAILALVVAAFTQGQAAVALTGGPDAAGYTFIDSNSPGGPTFSYVDIKGSGTLAPNATDADDSVDTGIPIGFTFVYYEVNHTTITISSNGNLQLGSNDSDAFSNTAIPTSTFGATGGALMVFWDDLDTRADGPGTNGCGDVYYQTLGSAPNRRFVVEWNVCHHTNPNDGLGCAIDVEAILFEGSNDILFQYLDASFTPATTCPTETGGHFASFGQSASVGIQGNSSIGLQYSMDTNFLVNGLAILFEAVPFEDSDGDGVPDASDECPNTQSGLEVDENGCADNQLDDDRDGVPNSRDDCPQTPEGDDVDRNGCTIVQTVRPNVGGAIAAILRPRATPTRQPQTAAPSTGAPAGTLAPPRTGDGGLVHD